MRLKLDENLPPSLVALFEQAGNDVETVRSEDLGGATDEELFEVARREDRALVSLDLDFSNPLRFPPDRTAGVVVIRTARPLVSTIEAVCEEALAELTSGDVRGRLWIVEPGRIREYTPETE